jgi:hypothetical protein
MVNSGEFIAKSGDSRHLKFNSLNDKLSHSGALYSFNSTSVYVLISGYNAIVAPKKRAIASGVQKK